MQNCQAYFPGKEAIPAIVNLGQYDEIISYTEIQDGIIFVIRAKRTKNDPERGGALFKYFNVELKMEFLSKNTCRFTYLNHDEIDGYLFGSFGNITREDLIYERIPVEDNPKEDVKGLSGKELDPETGLYYYGARYLDPVVLHMDKR